MFYKVKSLEGFSLDGLDGDVGKVKEFYFDDQHWAIRYLVADTGNWLVERQVLISPYALDRASSKEERISICLTKKQIEGSPSLDTDKPVSRQFEEEYYSYFNWPLYWNGPYMWGYYSYPAIDTTKQVKSTPEEKSWDPHLRSTHSVTGHHIQAIDGEIGHVEDFIIDDESWAIRYLVVNTHNFWPGKKVLISPQWMQRVSWDEKKVFVNLSRDIIKSAPEYMEDTVLTRNYERSLHEHYKTKEYWVGDPVISGNPH